MGRPQKEIDKKIFENLCGLQCTLEEIAGVFDCSVDTIERWCKREYRETFAEVYKKHSAKGKTSLRRTQFKLAEKSPAMAIFLGKNYLGQSDKIQYENTDSSNGQLADLINGLKDNVYTKATPVDGAVADEPTEKN